MKLVLGVRRYFNNLKPQYFSRVPPRCEETAWIPILAFVECTLLAQVALTLRLVLSGTGRFRTER